ncbi:hypothetical protein LDENG_00061100 [Lucifuga dentata]|nr:hypothetical protein LDENG_00061100 [Lucifuga dentata]
MAEAARQADHEEEQDKESSLPDSPGGSRTVRESAEGSSSPICQPEEAECVDQQCEEVACVGCGCVGVLTLPCGHKLCPACIQVSVEELGEDGCVICYNSQLMDSVLHNLLDALFRGQPRRPAAPPQAAGDGLRGREGGVEDGEAALCPQHGERLSTFCLDDDELLCVLCQREQHSEHECCSTQDAILHCKRELRLAVRSLRDQVGSLTSIRRRLEDMEAHIKSQSAQSSRFAKEEFEKLHQYLRDEEAALMSSLKQEEEEKSQRMKEKIDKVNSDMRELTDAITESEEAMGLEDFLFLKSYKKTSDRARCKVDEPEEESGSLLDVAKHQGCLQYRVWDKMQSIIQYFLVTLDPNTASVCLGVSPDMSSVFVCEEQPLPDNPERFVSPQSVLGSEGFGSGRHSWEVEVGDNSHWSLGVANESVRRNDWSNSDLTSASDKSVDPGEDLWTVTFSSGEYHASPGHSGPLKLRRRPRRVRIQLDWERGCLTFSDANDNSLIHRFKKQWDGVLRPYLSTTCSKHPLRVTAARVSVVTE